MLKMRAWSVCRWESAQAWLKENDMRILIAYGTSEGQTRKIANKVAARMHELGHDAHLFDTASLEDIDVPHTTGLLSLHRCTTSDIKGQLRYL